MKFAGELKFPDIDHPGVPVQFVIEEAQAELIVEGESLGRWSLFDVRARRLIASAFEIDLDGTELTFVAADPIDFAYRGVEHMAQTWASMKSKRIATRTIAVRKSRRGTKPSRIEDLRAAMQSNLESAGPQPIPGEPAMPSPERAAAATEAAEPEHSVESDVSTDWDQRDPGGAIPLVGGVPKADDTRESDYQDRAKPMKSDEELSLEAEKAALAEERARLEAERRAAEEREANLIEAYRLEVERLEAEREELRRQAARAAEQSAADREAAEEAAREASERAAAEEKARAEEEAAARAELEREAAEREERERQAREREAAVQAELERRVAEREARERAAAEREAAEREAREAAEREAREAAEREAREAAEREAREAAERDREEAEARAEEEEEPRPAAAFDASAFRRSVVDLDDLEEDRKDEPPEPPPSAPAPTPKPEPALAGAPREKSGGGLMGAVKAAFRSGPKDHEHQFVEAPGGIGITRYVCEECGYVSISV